MDAARTAWRLVKESGKVTIVYRRTMKQMPADQGEIKAVLEEGVDIVELCNPVEVKSENGRIKSIRCQKMILGPSDTSGRPKPVAVDGEFVEFPVDTIIPAIGQEKAFDFGNEKLLIAKVGSYETQLTDVFIGGDAMRGASTAINAIGDGRKAAEEILGKIGLEKQSDNGLERPKSNVEDLMLKKVLREEAAVMNESDLSARKNFEVVSSGLTENEVRKEAARCLKCDEICNLCTTVCPNLAFHSYQSEALEYQIHEVDHTRDELRIQNSRSFTIKQDHQILHIADWCNHCGNCTTFCPTSDAPYKVKAHLYLDEEEFYKEKDGFYLNNKEVLQFFGFKERKCYKLIPAGEDYEFSSNNFKINLSKKDLSIKEIIKSAEGTIIDTEMAVMMQTLLAGAKDFLQIN